MPWLGGRHVLVLGVGTGDLYHEIDKGSGETELESEARSPCVRGLVFFSVVGRMGRDANMK